jgi:murein DD-endopeptidase MepM/ murein hydrolase activator NlpD
MPTHQEYSNIINYKNFHTVVPFDGLKDKLLLLDFTEANHELTGEILADTRLFSEYINSKLRIVNAVYGIGGYNEQRSIYSRSTVFDGDYGGEPRSVHLGIDIWGPLSTPVYAPLQGSVHSFNFNDRFGDYGATVVLQHELEGVIFHTLYGHLSLHSIEDKKEGQAIEKGEWIAAFGEPEENGHWPSHLHFQIISDMQGMRGDYPGVCKYSERDHYLANCPDPDLILRMMKYIF